MRATEGDACTNPLEDDCKEHCEYIFPFESWSCFSEKFFVLSETSDNDSADRQSGTVKKKNK